jgi:ornithine carbamoyltransferase
MNKDFLSVADLDRREAEHLIEQAYRMKREGTPTLLAGRTLALLFEKPSLRTKVSFDLAMYQLGGHSIYLSPEEVGLGKREPAADVARVLSRYVDGITARTFSHETLRILAARSSVPVINALSDLEHPCQALADLLTIYEQKGKLAGLTLTYVGDGNNVANSLLLSSCLLGVDFRLATPAGYDVTEEVLNQAKGFAAQSGSRIQVMRSAHEAAKDADVIYTDVWTSMGQEAEADKRRLAFAGYQVDDRLLDSAKADVMFMHPLPAHPGEEISAGLLDDPRSAVFNQAENRLHLQKALLAKLLANP